MPGCWSEHQDDHQPEDAEPGEGGGCLEPHLGPDDVRALEEEEHGQVAHDAAALVQAPEHRRVPPRGGGRGVNGQELALGSGRALCQGLIMEG